MYEIEEIRCTFIQRSYNLSETCITQTIDHTSHFHLNPYIFQGKDYRLIKNSLFFTFEIFRTLESYNSTTCLIWISNFGKYFLTECCKPISNQTNCVDFIDIEHLVFIFHLIDRHYPPWLILILLTACKIITFDPVDFKWEFFSNDKWNGISILFKHDVEISIRKLIYKSIVCGLKRAEVKLSKVRTFVELRFYVSANSALDAKHTFLIKVVKFIIDWFNLHI